MKEIDYRKDPSMDDWRLHAVTRLASDWLNPWSGQVVPAGARMTVVSVSQLTKKTQLTIPLPNATALMLNSAARAYASAQTIRNKNGIDDPTRSHVSFENDDEAFDCVERIMEAIILAFTGLEAFVNEALPNDLVYSWVNRKTKLLQELSKAEIERSLEIDEKLDKVLPHFLKCTTPKKSPCWTKYKQLKSVRNRIIHMKSADRRSTLADVDTLWKHLFLTPDPHRTVKAVIDHFIGKMNEKPGWHSKYPY
jgi:hypothetical protein